MTVVDADADQTTAPTRPRPPFVRWQGAAGGGAVIAVLLISYAAFLSVYFSPAIFHPDANGYWAQGSRIVDTGRSWFKPQSPAQYIGMHWLLTPDGKYVSRYPPGLPVVVGVVEKVFGWEASVLVNPVLAVLTLLGVYLVVSRLASPGWGVSAGILLVTNTAFTSHAVTSISHPAVAFCLVWGIYCLMRWSVGGLWWAFAAGVAFGCIPSIRYADSIVAIGVAAYFLLSWGRHPSIWKHYLAAAGGAAVPIVPLLVRNQLVFGRFWRTGYALTNESTGFSWKWFTQHAVGYLQLLQDAGLGMVFALGLVGMIWMCFARPRRALGAMLLLSAGSLIVLYMAYYWAQGIAGGIGGPGNLMGLPGGGTAGAMRFYVPIVPLFTIAGVWALAEGMRSAPRAAKILVPSAIIGLQCAMYGPAMLAEMDRSHEEKVPLARAARALVKVAGSDDVVVANPAMLQDLDFVKDWKLADPSLVNGWGIQFGGGPGDPNAPAPQQMAKEQAEARRYKGSMVAKQRRFRDDLRAWAGKGSVYLIGTDEDINRLVPGIRRRDLTEVSRVATDAPRARKDRADAWRQFFKNGPFGYAIEPGQDVVIARWDKE